MKIPKRRADWVGYWVVTLARIKFKGGSIALGEVCKVISYNSANQTFTVLLKDGLKISRVLPSLVEFNGDSECLTPSSFEKSNSDLRMAVLRLWLPRERKS